MIMKTMSKPRKHMFVCSINEKYIPRILNNIAFSLIILGRASLAFPNFDDNQLKREVKNYPYKDYRFFKLLFFIKPSQFFDNIFLACYDTLNIPLSFYSLQWYCLIFSKVTTFISPDGKSRSFNRKELFTLIIHQTLEKISKVYLLNFLITFILLIIKFPYTLIQVFRAFAPNQWKISNREFWAFSKVDAGFRPWYNKIANDYKERGRFGYAWDDGLGIALGPRIYNNWMTYLILRIFGTRSMMALGYIGILAAIAIIASNVFSPLIGISFTLLLAASPLLISLYTHMGKPEIFWHALIPLWVYFIFTSPVSLEQVLIVGLTWSFIAFVNVSVPVICGLMLAPVILFLYFESPYFSILIAAFVPGIIKIILRVLYMIRDGFFSRVAKEQSRLSIDRFYFSIEESKWIIPFVLSIILASAQSLSYEKGALLLVAVIFIYWINGRNGRIVKLNDFINMNSILGSIAIGYALACGSITGLIAILIFYYALPSSCDYPIQSKNFLTVFRSFPAFNPIAFPFPQPLKEFFDHIPNNSRIVSESDGDPRTQSLFKRFWQWTEEFFPLRHIDVVNEMYTTFVEPQFMEKYVNRLKPGTMTPSEISNLCENLGIQFFICYTHKMETELKEARFTQIASIDLNDFPQFTALIRTPSHTLRLFKNSIQTTLIDPPVSYQYNRSNLSWNARAHTRYIIRYRYYPQFKAFQGQNQEPLILEKYQPFEDVPLTFMTVKPTVDGPIVLKFQKRCI